MFFYFCVMLTNVDMAAPVLFMRLCNWHNPSFKDPALTNQGDHVRKVRPVGIAEASLI